MKSVAIYAILASTASAVVLPRAISGPSKNYECNDGSKTVTFSSSYITSVITGAAKDKASKDKTAAAIEVMNTLPMCEVSKTTQRNNDFCQPKDFKNHADMHLSFPDCPSGPWLEFPLMSDGKTQFSGNKAPGESNPARVIFQYSNANTAKFCGVVTHSSATKRGNFVSCGSK